LQQQALDHQDFFFKRIDMKVNFLYLAVEKVPSSTNYINQENAFCLKCFSSERDSCELQEYAWAQGDIGLGSELLQSPKHFWVKPHPLRFYRTGLTILSRANY
jgi:hypothetical protein